MSNSMDEIYKQKYLKYKAKYFELKKIEEQMGGFTLDDGIMCFFTSSELATSVKALFDNGKTPKLDKIREVLHNQAYLIEDGDKELELVLKPANLFKKAEALPDNKPKKVAIVGHLFNRCSSDNVREVKSVLGAYKFTPNALLVVRIFKSDKNKLMSHSSI
jgi:hypothetical protein